MLLPALALVVVPLFAVGWLLVRRAAPDDEPEPAPVRVRTDVARWAGRPNPPAR